MFVCVCEVYIVCVKCGVCDECCVWLFFVVVVLFVLMCDVVVWKDVILMCWDEGIDVFVMMMCMCVLYVFRGEWNDGGVNVVWCEVFCWCGLGSVDDGVDVLGGCSRRVY